MLKSGMITKLNEHMTLVTYRNWNEPKTPPVSTCKPTSDKITQAIENLSWSAEKIRDRGEKR